MIRIWHPYNVWECVPGGMYESVPPSGMSSDDCLLAYAEFLSNRTRFRRALHRVVNEWPISCEHFLTNSSMNRIAWLGQASLCIETRIPCVFRSGFKRLSDLDQRLADSVAADTLHSWMSDNGATQPCLTYTD